MFRSVTRASRGLTLAVVLVACEGMAARAQAAPCTANPVPGLVAAVTCNLVEFPGSFSLDISSQTPVALTEFLNNLTFGTNWIFEIDIAIENGPVAGGLPHDRVSLFGTVFHKLHPPGDPLAPGGPSQVFGFSFVMPAVGALLQPTENTFRNHEGHRDRYFQISSTIGRNPGSPATQIDSWGISFRGEHERQRVPPIPEPATLLLLGSGLVALQWLAKQRPRR